MKDFHDIWMLPQTFDFNRENLTLAIAATFHRGGTEIPARRSDALIRNFGREPLKIGQWRSFVEGLVVTPPGLSVFLMSAAIEANRYSGWWGRAVLASFKCGLEEMSGLRFARQLEMQLSRETNQHICVVFHRTQPVRP